jgi:hypothetical protein
MGSALSRRVARLEQRAAAQQPTPCAIRYLTLLRLGDEGYEPCVGSL